MFRRHAHRRPLNRAHRPASHLTVESLESRVVLAASIGFDARLGIVSIVGTEAADVAAVSQQGQSIVVSLTGASSKTFRASQVRAIDFKGLGGDDSFTNNTALRSTADGGAGRDTLRGGSSVDDLRGGDDDDRLFGNPGNDLLYGGSGNDSIDGGVGNDREYGDTGADVISGGKGDDLLYGGDDNDDLYGDDGTDQLYGDAGDDHLDGRAGRDKIYGGKGLDREDDGDDRFSDGDDDGDGYDNDHDRPVTPGLVTPITFTETEPGVSTAQVTGDSANERDKDYYSFTAAASQTLTVTVAPDANGRYAEVEVKNGTTGRKIVELEPGKTGVASVRIPVTAGASYVIKVNSPSDYVAVGYTIDLTLDNSTIAPPVIGTSVVFDATGFSQLTGTLVGKDAKKLYSFTATTTGSLAVTILPDANGRSANLELKNWTTRREMLELEPSKRYGRSSGVVAVVAGETYVIEIESPSSRVAVNFTINLQLT